MRLFDAVLPALVIARREVRDQFRDWRIIFPVVGLTVLFPFLMNFTANQILNFVREYGANIIGERLIPFLLMIVGFFPTSASLVISLETFVGEKERGSIEPLLNTPLKDWQLYMGKLLSSTVPPLISSYLGMGVYLAGISINRIPLPEPQMLVLIISLATVQAVVMVAGGVVVSSQATSVRAANLLASFIIIPVAFLVQGEAILMFWGNYQTLWWAVIGLTVLAFLLVRVGLAHFQREELLGREIDVLNIRWGVRVFWRSFSGNARSLLEWYRLVIAEGYRLLKIPFLIVTILVIAGVVIGMDQVNQFPFTIPASEISLSNGGYSSILKYLPFFSLGHVIAVWWQNVRVLLLAFVMGIFTFGVLGVLPVMATVGVAGYLIEILNRSGIQILPIVLGLIAPHGIIEIPAAILATALVLRAGAIMATPVPGKTVGEVWLESLGIWARTMTGVVIPLLFIAAVIEVWVTPRLASLILN
ncbi:MAG TPA: stage II sporulation protein M [Anaerolineaceae bacterium]